jgi:hypothetical protein
VGETCPAQLAQGVDIFIRGRWVQGSSRVGFTVLAESELPVGRGRQRKSPLLRAEITCGLRQTWYSRVWAVGRPQVEEGKSAPVSESAVVSLIQRRRVIIPGPVFPIEVLFAAELCMGYRRIIK